MTETRHPFGISGSTLKLIAIITMFIDHTGATVLRAILRHPAVLNDPALCSIWQSVYRLSRDIGRFAFPIFCFLLVEGFLHTRNVKKYAGRMFLFALISEIPFDLALKGNWYFPEKQNVYFTLLIGLLVLIAMSYLKYLWPLALAAGMYAALQINTDYNFKGVFLIAILYLLRKDRLMQCAAGGAAVAWELPAPLSFLPIYLYNGTRGLRMKYVFYWFYPAHLLILHVIAKYLVPLIPA